MKKLYYLFIFILLPFCSHTQPLQQIAHPPSKEIYDLLVDKKGFLWLAHDLGVSRYDGISFTSFSNPAQTAISMTDLVQDNYGRIWCHNFNGQIFYIQDDKMVYLKEYDFRNETRFPRLVLYGDEIVITSAKGLFFCNTTTLKCHYLLFGSIKYSFSSGTTSLSIINDTILAYGFYKWYIYTKSGGIQILEPHDLLLPEQLSTAAVLQPKTFGKIAVMIDNKASLLYGVTLINGNLKVVFKKNIGSYINTISFIDNQLWINTLTQSFNLDSNKTINGHNITAQVYDREGNKWISSLTHGLLFSPRTTAGWKIIQPIATDSNDYVRSIQKIKGGFVIGSQYGKLAITGTGVSAKNNVAYTIPPAPGNGTIENIQAPDNINCFIETSVKLFILNKLSRRLLCIDSSFVVKDITLNSSYAYMATAGGLLKEDLSSFGLKSMAMPHNLFSIKDSMVILSGKFSYLKKMQRCRAVSFDASTNSLLVSFTDGLQRLKDNQLTYILYNGQPLYVSSMARYGKKIYAGSFNNGLFEIDSFTVKKIANDAESPLDAIVKIKCCNNHIWIFRTHDIEVLDADKDEFVNNIPPLPVDATDVTDVEEDSSNIYLASHQGLYTIPLAEKAEIVKTDPSLLYLLINNTDTVYNDGITLQSNKNNLLFRLAIPFYENAEQLHFKYRLLSGNNTTGKIWYYTQDAQRDIQFNALKPGSYGLEIIAVKSNEVISNKPLQYHFTIQQPWFNTWWFYACILFFTAAAFFALYQYRLRQVFKIERIRRKISNDLHDDIGSTLSSINVYSQLARSGKDNREYIDTIQTNTVGIINSLDDLVWNINPKNDILKQLLGRMQLFAEPLLEENNIECIFKVKAGKDNILVSPAKRANIYLLFKEAINNVLKHSGCSVCSIYIIQKGKMFRLTVKDNGRGFNTNNINTHRNGLRSMGERAKDIKGSIVIKSTAGNGTEIKLNCYLK